MRRTISPLLAPGLAILGVVLWVFAIGSTFGFVARGPSEVESALMIGGFILGGVCHLGAILASIARWQREGGWPVVAALYVLTVVGGFASWAWASGEDDRFLQANPDSFMIEPASGDSVLVRSAAGIWMVSLDACPGRGDGSVQSLGSSQSAGVADISYGPVPYYMRLHVAEQRVECLSPAPDWLQLSIGSYLEGGIQIELRDSLLVSRETIIGDYGDTLSVTVPTDEDWRAFRATLDSLSVYLWQPEYPNPGIDDGTDWSAEIVYSDWRVTSTGINAFPSLDGTPAPLSDEPYGTSEAFEAFLGAVERLSGQRFR